MTVKLPLRDVTTHPGEYYHRDSTDSPKSLCDLTNALLGCEGFEVCTLCAYSTTNSKGLSELEVKEKMAAILLEYCHHNDL